MAGRLQLRHCNDASTCMWNRETSTCPAEEEPTASEDRGSSFAKGEHADVH